MIREISTRSCRIISSVWGQKKGMVFQRGVPQGRSYLWSDSGRICRMTGVTVCLGKDIPGPGYRCVKAGGMAETAAWALWGAGHSLNVGEVGRAEAWREARSAKDLTLPSWPWNHEENHEGILSREATAGRRWHSPRGDKRSPVR